MTEGAEEAIQDQPKKRRFRWPLITTGAVTIVSGFLGGWAGSALTVNASKEAEQRTRVGVVYAAYLDAANSYNNAVRALDRALDTAPAGSAGDVVVRTAENDFIKAKFDYKGAINDVYVYGSEEAWARHEQVAALFSSTLNREGPRGIDVPDEISFTLAHNGFLNVFCREAVAKPREGCHRPGVRVNG